MKIKVLLVMPGKEVQIIKIPNSIKFIKSFIGKELDRIKLNENTILIGNKNPNLEEFNRIINGEILLGMFIIVSIKNNRRVSMKKKDIRKFINIFKLRKHQKKVNILREEYLEEYYSNQRNMKLKSAEKNKKDIFNLAA